MTPIPGVILLPSAWNDLQSNFLFLGRQNRARANEFARQLQLALTQLAQTPHLGSPRFYANPRLHSIRRWPIPNFERYGIFYRPFASGNGIEVFRVAHASRDMEALLKESLEP